MAVTTQTVTPTRSYTPLEGLSEAQRLVSAVPRGLIRFEADIALTAKAINDDFHLDITGSLPPSFAYIFSAMSFQLQADTSSDFEGDVRLRLFNVVPTASLGNEQIALFDLDTYTQKNVSNQQRILTYAKGSLREWFPQVLYAPPGGFPSFTLSASNGADPAMAAGTMLFHAAFYQYELNQAVRFPLNSPVPVGIR